VDESLERTYSSDWQFEILNAKKTRYRLGVIIAPTSSFCYWVYISEDRKKGKEGGKMKREACEGVQCDG